MPGAKLGVSNYDEALVVPVNLQSRQSLIEGCSNEAFQKAGRNPKRRVSLILIWSEIYARLWPCARGGRASRTATRTPKEKERALQLKITGAGRCGLERIHDP